MFKKFLGYSPNIFKYSCMQFVKGNIFVKTIIYHPGQIIKRIKAVTKAFQQCGMCDQQRLRPASYAQSDQSLYLSLEYSVTIKLLTEHHLEFLDLKGNCTCLSVYTLVKMPHCCKSHAAAHK